jgi:hypothetical protein
MTNFDKYPNEPFTGTTGDDYVAVCEMNNGLGAAFVIKNTGDTNDLKYKATVKLAESPTVPGLEITVLDEAVLGEGATSAILTPSTTAFRKLIFYVKSATGSAPTTYQLDALMYGK